MTKWQMLFSLCFLLFFGGGKGRGMAVMLLFESNREKIIKNFRHE